MQLTVVDWNLGHAFGRRDPKVQAAFLGGLGADFLLLQEVTPECFRELKEHFGDRYWSRHTVPNQEVGRSGYGCAILGLRRTSAPISVRRLSTHALRDIEDESARIKARGLALFGRVRASGMDLTVASVHIWNARGGREFRRKRSMIHAVSESLRQQRSSAIVGIDANGPKVDCLNPNENIYWGRNTSRDRHEYLLHEPGRGHELVDAYRAYLNDNPHIRRMLEQKRHPAPLAVSHRRGRRKEDCRYDFIFTSRDLTPAGVEYREDVLANDLSDRAPVVARLVTP